MSKEMHEQPQAVADTLLDRRGAGGELILDEMRLSADDAARHRQGVHRGLRLQLPRRAGGQVRHRALGQGCRPRSTSPASSATATRCSNERTLCVGVSQSGETLDTSEAMREAKRLGAKVLVVSNVVDSSMARAADGVLYTRAGPEIGVASTKCHLAQIVALEVLGLYLAQIRGTQPAAEINEILDAMDVLPGLVSEALSRAGDVDDVAAKLTDARDFFFLGRHVGYPVALEGALKLKELAYLRAEGYPAGELKHGPDRPDRAGHGGRRHRHPQPAVGEDAVQHRRGAQPRRHGRAGGRRRRRGVGGRGRPRAVGPPDLPAPRAGGRRGAAAAAGLPAGPPARARRRTARATWPRR